MAPFRNRDRSNRSGRGQVEHNVLEGLPINQYREVEITIGPNSAETKQADKDAWPELPMPRESHLLPEHSQQLLRAARAGKIFKPPAPPEEDNETRDEEDDHKEVPQGFTVKKWVKVARHLEEPEPEYLAKRRKGLPSQYSIGQAAVQPSVMRETKVKKTDAEGNVIVYKALVPEGQAIEGEVQGTDGVIEAAPVVAAPGTVVEGVGVVNAEGVVVANDTMQQTPQRKRHTPLKKKKRGPGRGRKKVIFAEGAEQGAQVSGVGSHLLAVSNVKQEGSVEPSEGGDTPMPDAGDEEEGSGEEGSDEEDHEGTHSPPPTEAPPSTAPTEPASQPDAQSPAKPDMVDTIMADSASTMEPRVVSAELATAPVIPADTKTSLEPKQEPEKGTESWPKPKPDPSSSPDMPLSTISHSRQNSISQVPTTAALETSAQEHAPETVPVMTPAQVHMETGTEAPTSAGEVTLPAPSSDVRAPKVEMEPVAMETKVQPVVTEAPSKAQDQVPEEGQGQTAQEVPEKIQTDPPSEFIAQAKALKEEPTETPAEPTTETPLKDLVDARVDGTETSDSKPAPAPSETLNESQAADNSEPDLLGSLESHLEKERETMAKAESS